MLFQKFRTQTCPHCGANKFKRLEDGSVKCEYCDSILQAQEELNHNNTELPNKTISGDMQKLPKYIVYEKLIVTGDMNKIKISRNLKDGIPVKKLKISGNMNKGTVALVDKATCEVTGDMNDVN